MMPNCWLEVDAWTPSRETVQRPLFLMLNLMISLAVPLAPSHFWRRMLPRAVVIFAAVSSNSCVSQRVSPYLDYAERPGFSQSLTVASGSSTVVFARPDDIRALSALLFDGDRFLTILTELTYFIYETIPGSHKFVSRVTGRGLSFMDAELAPNKIYFAAVKYGEGNAWFELIPIIPNSDYWRDLPLWLQQSRAVRPNDSAFKWFEERRAALLKEQDANETKARRHGMLEEYGVGRIPQ